VDNGHEIHLEHRVDVAGLLLLEQAAGHQAGVVDEQVYRREAARIALDRLARGEVERHGAHLSGPAGRRHGRRSLAAHAAEEEVERAAGQLRRDGPADAAARAGHEGGLSI